MAGYAPATLYPEKGVEICLLKEKQNMRFAEIM